MKFKQIFFMFLWSTQLIASEKLFDQHLLKIDRYLKKTEHLTTVGTGGSCPKGVIYKFNLSLEGIAHVLIPDARKQMIRICSHFTEQINSDQKIRPYLANHPFNSKNFNITIFYSNPSGGKTEAPYLGSITLNNGIIYYDMTKPVDKRKSSYDLTVEALRETYDEALEKLKSEEKSD